MSDEERERRQRVFTPTLERLVALIRGRVRFHENFDAWHRDERQDFKRARCGGGSGACRLVRKGRQPGPLCSCVVHARVEAPTCLSGRGAAL